MSDATTRLAASALELYEQQGFAATSVREIAEAAGVTERTFYRHFPRKELTLFPDHEAMAHRIRTYQPESVDLQSSIEDALRHIVEARQAASALWRRRYEVIDTTPELAAFERSLDVHLIELLAERLALLQPHPDAESNLASLRSRAAASMITFSASDILRAAARQQPVAELIADLARMATSCLNIAAPATPSLIVIAAADLSEAARRDIEGAARQAVMTAETSTRRAASETTAGTGPSTMEE